MYHFLNITTMLPLPFPPCSSLSFKVSFLYIQLFNPPMIVFLPVNVLFTTIYNTNLFSFILTFFSFFILFSFILFYFVYSCIRIVYLARKMQLLVSCRAITFPLLSSEFNGDTFKFPSAVCISLSFFFNSIPIQWCSFIFIRF